MAEYERRKARERQVAGLKKGDEAPSVQSCTNGGRTSEKLAEKA